MTWLQTIRNWLRNQRTVHVPPASPEARLSSHGDFRYDAEGFAITVDDKRVQVKWNEIQKLNTYKIDRFAFDDIMLEVYYRDKCLELCEDLPGFYFFIVRLGEHLPSPCNWLVEVARPAFATNERVLFERVEQV